MAKYAIYNMSSGKITRVVEVPASIISAQLTEGEAYILNDEATPFDSIKLDTMELEKGSDKISFRVNNLDELPLYVQSRRALYPSVGEQLDLLFKDVESGMFGESAKQSTWFRNIDAIKRTIPKESDTSGIVYMAGEAV